MFTFLWYPKQNLSLFWGPAIAIFQPTADCIFTGAWNDPSAMYNKLCNPLIQHREGHSVYAPLPSYECNKNCFEYHLIPYPAFGDATLLRPAKLCTFPSVPSASKQPLMWDNESCLEKLGWKAFWWKTEIVCQWNLCNKMSYFLVSYRSGWTFPF